MVSKLIGTIVEVDGLVDTRGYALQIKANDAGVVKTMITHDACFDDLGHVRFEVAGVSSRQEAVGIEPTADQQALARTGLCAYRFSPRSAQELRNPSDVSQIIMNLQVDQIRLGPESGNFVCLVCDRVI